MNTTYELLPIVNWATKGKKQTSIKPDNLPVETQKQIRWCQDWCKNRLWFLERNRNEFYQNIKGLVLAIINELPRQIKLFKAVCFETIDADRTDHALHLLGRKDPFADIGLGAYQNIHIRGAGENDWRIVQINNFAQRIPPEHLETLTRLRMAGVEPDAFAVAEPVPKPVVKVKPKDPVLLIKFGRYMCEVGRWV